MLPDSSRKLTRQVAPADDMCLVNTLQGLSALAAAPSITQLQQLDLTANHLGAAAAAGLQQLLVNAKQLQSLKLRGTGLGDDGAQGVADGLSAAVGCRLGQLDLSSTGLGAAGVGAVAATVSAAGAKLQLQQLLLGGNPAIDDEAICKLAHAFTAAAAPQLSEQQPVQEQQQRHLMLDISHSGVGVEGLQALSTVEALEHLSLFGCRIGGDGGE